MEFFSGLFGNTSASPRKVVSNEKGKQRLQSLCEFIGEEVPDLPLSPVPSTASWYSDSSDDPLSSVDLEHVSSTGVWKSASHRFDSTQSTLSIAGTNVHSKDTSRGLECSHGVFPGATIDVEVLSLGGNTVTDLRELSVARTRVWDIKQMISKTNTAANSKAGFWAPIQMQLRFGDKILNNPDYLEDVLPDGVGRHISLMLVLSTTYAPKKCGSMSRKLTGCDSDSD